MPIRLRPKSYTGIRGIMNLNVEALTQGSRACGPRLRSSGLPEPLVWQFDAAQAGFRQISLLIGAVLISVMTLEALDSNESF